MALQTENGMSVLELQCSSAAWELAHKKERNQVLLRLLTTVYFIVEHRISHTTTYSDLIELLVPNGDEILPHPPPPPERVFTHCIIF